MQATLVEVPVGAVRLSQNIRSGFNEREQEELAASIARHGVLVPLLGHGEASSPMLDDGHRRLDGAKRAGRATVPMLLAGRAPSEAERLTLQMVASAHRVDLKVTEKARAIRRLMLETGWSAAEVSATLGSPSPAMVSKLLALLVLPQGAQDQIDAGRIPVSSAYAIATVADPQERERLLGAVASGTLRRDKLLREIGALSGRRRTAKKHGRPRASAQRIAIPLGGRRTVTVSAPALSPEEVANWLAKLAGRLRRAGEEGRTMAEAVRMVSAARPDETGSEAA